MKNMKKIVFLTSVILAMAVWAIAGNYRLPTDGTGKFAVQGYSPQSNVAVKTTSAVKNSFKNFTTSGLAALKCTSRVAASATAAGALTPVKVRVGGFATGSETDVYPASEDTYWSPPGKIGFQTYSGAVLIHCTKQP